MTKMKINQDAYIGDTEYTLKNFLDKAFKFYGSNNTDSDDFNRFSNNGTYKIHWGGRMSNKPNDLDEGSWGILAVYNTIISGNNYIIQIFYQFDKHLVHCRTYYDYEWHGWARWNNIKSQEKYIDCDSAGNGSLGISSDEYRLIDIVQVGTSFNGVVTHYCYNNQYFVHIADWNGNAVSGNYPFRITYLPLNS